MPNMKKQTIQALHWETIDRHGNYAVNNKAQKEATMVKVIFLW